MAVPLPDKLGLEPRDEHIHAEVVGVLAAQVAHMLDGPLDGFGKWLVDQRGSIPRIDPGAAEQIRVNGGIRGQHIAIVESGIGQDFHHSRDQIELFAEGLFDQHIAQSGMFAQLLIDLIDQFAQPLLPGAEFRRWGPHPGQRRAGDQIEEFTFIDAGAGMGRAMLLAAEFPFRQIEGIELNAILANIARRNAAKWRAAGKARSRMRVSCRDVVEFEFPKAPCLVFLFNPFGASVMRRLLTRIASAFEERPGQLDLLYVNHEQEHVLESQRGFVRLFWGKVPRSRADAIADYRIMANQPDGEYEASNYEDCSIWRWEGL